jgi:hypothetical protein
VKTPLLSKYFPDQIIIRFSSGFCVDKPLDIQWPDLKVYESRYADSIAWLSEFVSQVVKELNMQQSMQGWQFWLFAITTVATIVLAAAVILLFL